MILLQFQKQTASKEELILLLVIFIVCVGIGIIIHLYKKKKHKENSIPKPPSMGLYILEAWGGCFFAAVFLFSKMLGSWAEPESESAIAFYAFLSLVPGALIGLLMYQAHKRDYDSKYGGSVADRHDSAKERPYSSRLNTSYVRTKECPYCGEEILAIAKKCKHCHEYLDEESSMMECPICGETISSSSKICPICNEHLKR